MKLGISSYTYTWAVGVPGYPPPAPLRVDDLLQRAAASGVHVVQIADNLPLAQFSESEQDRLRAQAKAHDIQIEVGTRGIACEHLLGYLQIAERLGSKLLRVVIDTADHQPSKAEAISLIGAVLPEFEKAGVTLAIENHDRFYAQEFVEIITALSSPYVGICLDTVNSFGSLEGPEVVVGKLAPYTVNLHVKDFIIARVDHLMGFVITGRPAGQGRLDVPWLLTQLSSKGSDMTAVLELWTPPEQDIADTIAKEARWAEESIQYLRRHI